MWAQGFVVLSQFTLLTDRRIDGRTADSFLIAIPCRALHYMSVDLVHWVYRFWVFAYVAVLPAEQHRTRYFDPQWQV